MRCLFLLLILLCAPLRAEEPFFQKGDVIAIVGGEDMVALSEYGYLELLLTRGLPDLHLRFRNLAWEGDTVFEQRRDLNFPTWEEQLEKIGATVVLCQFGQMESLAGKEKLPEFIAAYGKLLARFSGGGKRRIVLVAPSGPFQHSKNEAGAPIVSFDPRLKAIEASTRQLAERCGAKFLPTESALLAAAPLFCAVGDSPAVRIAEALETAAAFDSLHTASAHLSELGHNAVAMRYSAELSGTPITRVRDQWNPQLFALIIAKNRLWFDYWRVQNWAFLAGDRTNQPSSRDHLDPAKRWFPEERERFLPLIEAKEKEIDTLAAQLAKP